MLQPQFDEHQFAHRAKAVSKETGIAWTDYERMHVERKFKAVKRRAGGPPLWSQNDTELRAVVLKFCERYVGIRNPSGTDAERLQAIREKAKAILPSKETLLAISMNQYHELQGLKRPTGGRDFAIQVQNRDSQVQVLRRGLPELAIAVATYSYRLGWDSPTVAQELRLRPPAVREWLYRMNKAAQGTSCPAYRNKPIVPWPADMIRKLFVMRVMGRTLKECCEALGVCQMTVAIRWRQAFGDLTVKKMKARALKSTRRKQRRWSDDAVRRLFVLRACNLSFSECASRLGTSQSYVVRLWRKHFGDLKLSRKA
jgi:hypothetical protein